MKNKEGSIRFQNLLNMFPLVGLFVYYLTRYIEGTYSFIIPLCLTIVWLVLAALCGKGKGLLTNGTSVWWMGYLFLGVFMVVLGLSSTNIKFLISRLPYYFIPIMGCFVLRYYNRKEKLFLLSSFLIIFYINLVYNIIIGYQFPLLFDEEYANTEENISFCISMNIADTVFVIICYLLIGTLIMMFLSVRRKSTFIFCIIMIAPIAYNILFQNTRGTAVLLSFTELVLFIFALFEPQKNKKVYYFFGILLLIMVAVVIFIPIMSWVLNNIQDARLATRFNALLEFRKSGGNVNVLSGSIADRLLLAKTSLNSFLSSPISIIIGIGDHTQDFGGDLIKSGIGGHSEFIDILARNGLIGAIVFFNIMKRYYILLKGLTSHRVLLKNVNVVFTIIIISGFLNLLFLPCLLCFMYIVFPIFIELSNELVSGEKNGMRY